jgi:hypothetical protein
MLLGVWSQSVSDVWTSSFLISFYDIQGRKEKGVTLFQFPEPHWVELGHTELRINE